MCATKIIALTVVILTSGIEAGVINRMFNPLTAAKEEFTTPCPTTFKLSTIPSATSALYPSETVQLHPSYDQFRVGSCTFASPLVNLPGRCETVPQPHLTWVVRQRGDPKADPKLCPQLGAYPDLVTCKEWVALPGACTLKVPASYKSTTC